MITVVPDKDSLGNIVQRMTPFRDKAVAGGKLYRRKYGFKSGTITDGNQEIVELIVPFVCKINEIEFVNAKDGVTVDFKVHDTSTGFISAEPFYMLNQFGFDVEMSDGLYRDISEYDADLVTDMRVRITVKNNTGSDYICKGNIVYHEVK